MYCCNILLLVESAALASYNQETNCFTAAIMHALARNMFLFTNCNRKQACLCTRFC